MRPIFVLALLLLPLVTTVLITTPCAAGDVIPGTGETFPGVPLRGELAETQRAYLNLPAAEAYRLEQIQSPVIVVQVFSMYCPHCQKAAPTVNRFFERLQADQRARADVKLIGIGVGNTAYEIQQFMQSYDVRFPLFTDGDYKVHELLGKPRTPYFWVLKRQPDGSNRIVHAQLGGFDSADEFFDLVLRRAGL